MMARFRSSVLGNDAVQATGSPAGLVVAIVALVLFGGCGTTKWTETKRTATEQLLISDSMDQAVSRIDFRALAGKTVFLDDTFLKDVVDAQYLVSSLRQQLLAHGAILKQKREEADYVVEVRAGAVGTDMHSLLVGVPQINLPSVAAAAGLPSSFPEIPLIKRTKQTAVTKILLFAYHRETGRPLWQSGTVLAKSDAQDIWIFFAGPFQRGSIYEGTQLAGDQLPISVPLIDPKEPRTAARLVEEAYYIEEPDPKSTRSRLTSKTETASPPDQRTDHATNLSHGQTAPASETTPPPSWSTTQMAFPGPVFPPDGPALGSPYAPQR